MEHPVKLKYVSFTECSKEKSGGDERNRTADLYVANVSLSQLSYSPTNLLPNNQAGGIC